MKKILLLVFALSCITISSSAQKFNREKFSIGLDGGLRNDRTSNQSQFMGVSVKYDSAYIKIHSFHYVSWI